MMKFALSHRGLLAALLALALAIPAAGLAGKGGGKPGGGEEPPPNDPGVRFTIEYFNSPNPNTYPFGVFDANEVGQIVGNFKNENGPWAAYVYDLRWDTGQAIDLNAITTDIPPGHIIRMALSINEEGYVAVYLDDETLDGLQLTAGMIDLNHPDETGQPLPKLYLVPNPDNRQLAAMGINDQGDLLILEADASPYPMVIYNFGFSDENLAMTETLPLNVTTTNTGSLHINNRTPSGGLPQIVGVSNSGVPFRLAAGGAYEEFPSYIDADGNLIEQGAPGGLNNFGEFCGSARIHYPKKIRGQLFAYANYVQGTTTTLYDTGSLDYANSINDSGDFITSSGVLQHFDAGIVKVTEWLDPNDEDVATFNAAVGFNAVYISGCIFNDSNLPMVVGWQDIAQSVRKGVVLIPVSAL